MKCRNCSILISPDPTQPGQLGIYSADQKDMGGICLFCAGRSSSFAILSEEGERVGVGACDGLKGYDLLACRLTGGECRSFWRLITWLKAGRIAIVCPEITPLPFAEVAGEDAFSWCDRLAKSVSGGRYDTLRRFVAAAGRGRLLVSVAVKF